MFVRTFMAGLFVVLFTLTQPAAAAAAATEYATAEEAQAMVERAITFYDTVGRDAAFKEINNKQGQFVDRDLYVLVGSLDGVFLAHGANPGLVGKNLTALKDVNGKLIGLEIIESAKTKPEGGWVEYVWTNPATKKLASKRTWVKTHDNLFFGAGVYDVNKSAQ